jgi:undecaprenyl-diphosphatase
MDFSLYQLINGYAHRHDLVEDPLRFCAVYAEYLFVALLAGLFLVRGKWRTSKGRRGVVAAGFSTTFALAAAQVISHLLERPRPYLAHPHASFLLVPVSHDWSFPSDHATAAFAIAVAIFLRHRKAGSLALVMAVMVSLGRVAVGVHYPADVAAGALLGTASALIFWHPSVRRPLGRLADWSGALYDRVVAIGCSRIPGTAAGTSRSR